MKRFNLFLKLAQNRSFVKRAIQYGLQIWGFLAILVTLGLTFFPVEFAKHVAPNRWVVIPGSILCSLYLAFPRSMKRRVGLSSVEIRVGDMFDIDADFVVACPRTFDTIVDDVCVRDKSAQCQLTKKFFNRPRRDLEQQVEQSLRKTETDGIKILNPPPCRNNKEYPVGTVAKLVLRDPKGGGEREGYFIGICHVTAEGVHAAEIDDVRQSIRSLWSYIREHSARSRPLCCPILGSGFAKVEASHQQLLSELVKSFILECRSEKGPPTKEGLIIAIHPDDLNEKVDLEALRGFLEYDSCWW